MTDDEAERDVDRAAAMSESGTGPGDEEAWDPQVERWRYPDGDFVLPPTLRCLPQPWDAFDWTPISGLPRTDEHVEQARRVLIALLDDRNPAPRVPQPPSPGLLWQVWEQFHEALARRVPRMSHVTWAEVDALASEWRDSARAYPLQKHVGRHVDVAMLALISRLRDDVADSVFRWLTLDTDPSRFADWAVSLAERYVIADMGADSAIELLGAMGGAEPKAALERLAAKPDGPATWDNAEAAESMLFELEAEGMDS
ncbi:hypothetical protein AB0E88_25025 [Streptomyces sp. NPDC028635]|uniref:hypothetical protein n=1 Tax=Streptomyces sp. NPDC028635 TaxID=3154800 RepID=UPI0033DF8136